MSENKDNPLYNIFIKTPKGTLSEEIDNVKNIQYFFNYLSNEKIKDDSKLKVIEELKNKIHINRYISEFFSSNNNKSIYIYLFDLYSNQKASQNFKESILSLINELRYNIQTGKDIYEYIFQKLSKIYRGEITPSSNNLYIYLKLLNIILGDTEACLPPKNYFACSGHCKFSVDLNKKPIEVGYSFTVNLNFKISNYHSETNTEKNRISNLIKIYFSNKTSLSVDLQYPFLLIVKEVRKGFIKTFPLDEWINLVITIENTKNGLQFYFYVNGENHPNPYKIEKLSLKRDDTIKYIDFFNNFYGEVSSIFMFSQKDPGPPGVNNSNFLLQFKNYKEGLWKKTIIDSFFKLLSSYDVINQPQTKNVEKKKNLWESLVFVFTPINYYETRPNIIEDAFGQYQIQFSGNIRNHQYQSYQKKLMLVSGFSNFYPIAEMFLIHPETLNEENLQLFLKTIGSILNFRKQNLKNVKQNKLFKILSMFLEKYPNKVFTEKILNALDSLGKTLFINNLESICSTYFNYILLNEKILSKYNENLQIKFWNKLYLFCQSDITQIEIFININRLCLILRFYDRNKYKEICCEQHLNMIKEEYVGSKKVMNPNMNKKLSNLKNIMDLIIDSQEPSKALSLFKLLTLDLSPCLTKFILNIFINALDKSKVSENWKDQFVDQLIQAKYEVIIINTFIHSLPDVRIGILKFVYQVHLRLVSMKKTGNFKIFENMIKTCLLPDKMFYSTKKIDKKNQETKNEKIKKDNFKKEEIKKESIKKEESKKENSKQEVKKENIIKLENKQDNKKEETKKQEVNQKSNKEEIKKIENKQEIKKLEKGEQSKENIIKKEIKKEDIKKDEPKKEEHKKEEPKATISKKEDTQKNTNIINQKQLEKKEENKKSEFKMAKTFQIKDNTKKEESSKPIKTGTNKQNFLALLSKFDKPKDSTKVEETKKIIPKKLQRDNPFFKSLNTPSINKLNEQTKKEVHHGKDEKLKEEKLKEEKLKEEEKKKEEKLKEEKLKEEKLKEEKLKEEKLKEEKLKEEKLKEEKLKEEKLKEEKLKEEKLKEEKLKEEKLKEEEKIKKEEEEKKRMKDIEKNQKKEDLNLINNKSTENDKIFDIKKGEDKIEITPNKIVSSTSSKTTIEEMQKNINKNESNSQLSNNKINNNFNTNEETLEEIIIKDSVINKYIERLYSTFILWSLSIDVSIPFDAIKLNNISIKNFNIIEIIFLLNNKLKNKKLIINFLKSIDKLTTNNSENCFQLFFNIKVFSSFLDITFENYKLKGKDEEVCYELGKNILINSFINSFSVSQKQKNQNPGKDLETLFIWGNKILKEDNSKQGLLFEFMHELLFDFLTQFKIKFEPKIVLDSSYNVEKNYHFKNYLYFITIIYTFVFKYKLDFDIYKKGINYLYSSSQKIDILEEFISSMRLNSEYDKINQSWIDYPLIYDMINRVRHIWSKKNTYKHLNIDKKKSKPEKYQLIMDNILLNKDKKNLYQKELVLLCFEDCKGGFEYIIPLIKIILITQMCILFKLKKINEEKDFKYWLKEFKSFIRFLIISSCNLTKINQLELYNSIQDKCLESISAGLCFLYNLYLSDSICKDKIEKNLNNLLLFCFKIIKYQFNYKIKHNTIFKIAAKPARNNLQDCAVCRLFNDYVKDKSGNPLMSLNILENIPLESNEFSQAINNLMMKQDFIDSFWNNKNLKNKLNDTIFSLTPYKKLVDYRFDLIPFLQDTFDESYKQKILILLPQYENELAKYSNNSLEKNIKHKTRYKVFKKNAFSWRGFWSCRENFFENISQFKYKLINHYTKNFMKPILVPIIDISYYLPEFSQFDPKNLFKKEKNENNKNKFELNLDIDKILRAYEQTQQETANIASKEKEENKENYLVSIYKKSNPLLYEKLLKISNNLEFGKEEEFAFTERESTDKNENDDKKNVKKYFLSCLVKTSHHIKGVCFIDDKKLNFKVFLNQKTGSAMSGVEVGFTSNDDDYDETRKTCFGSYFVCHPKDKDLYKISISYDDIKWIFKRKYYYTNSALEIYTTTNKTFYFNFKYETDRVSVLNEILKKLDEPIPIIDDLKEKETIIGYENSSFQKKKGEKLNKNIKLSKKIKMWKSWEISNFELLMWLNIFGNRSYNDISQYPVFPWTLSSYEDPLQVEQKIKKKKNQNLPEEFDPLNATYAGSSAMLNDFIDEEDEIIFDYQYRDMNLPMGMLELSNESIKRKEEFIMIYETLLEEPDENNKPYVFGSNYSNPIYVCNYLMRLFPFTHISIELQGQGFDKPDRLFISVKNSFYNSTSQKGDVRELIPEFFYLPEMFKNINKLNMGKLETGEEVNDVATPCHNNPYDFIMTMRNVLENNNISSTIQNWIDLIFGYKAKGKGAEISKNLFKEAAYQENIDINKIDDKESKLREVEFGLIPNQLMIKECIKRDRKEQIRKGKEITDSSCDLKCYKCKFHNENEKFNGIEGMPVIKFACFGSEKISLLLGGTSVIEKKIVYSTHDKTYYDEVPNIILINYYSNRMSDFYNPKKGNSKAVQFCHKGKTAILGGFYDGKVLIIPLDQKIPPTQLISFVDKSPIIAVAVDQGDEFAFFGNNIGNIRIMKIDKDPSRWKFDKIITDHLSPISYIDCCSELNLWASSSIDGYINLYTLPLSKLLRCLKIPISNCDYVFLSSSPLPSIIAIGEENKVSEIFIYSINGELLLSQKEESLLTCPIIIKDLNSNEYLAYIINGALIIRSLPTLIRQTNCDEIDEIFAICPSEDMKIMYATNKSGNQIYVIKDNPIKE